MKNEIKKTKVWQIIWGLKDGGAEVLAREYARLIDKQYLDATIVTLYPFENTANYRSAMEAHLKVISIFKKRNMLTRAVRLMIGNWYIPMVLRAMLKKDRPDTIHIHSQMACYFLPIKEQLSGIKMLYTCHNEPDRYFSEKEESAVKKLIQDNDLQLIALHEDMKAELDLHFSRDNTVVIRNGVDIKRFRECRGDRMMIRCNIGISPEAFVVGHIGRFAKQKNHTFLLKVFQKIAERKQNAHLLLVGNGELQEQITQEISRLNLNDRVTILSHRTDIPELLQAMDVMVFPSIFEGLSVTLVEAQASGLKCVISDSINPANQLTEKTISVSLNAEPEEWADIALNDAVRISEYGNLSDYDMNREIRRLERLYQGKSDMQ